VPERVLDELLGNVVCVVGGAVGPLKRSWSPHDGDLGSCRVIDHRLSHR